MSAEKEERIREIEEDISRLRSQLTDRKQALPMHDATAEQWRSVEEVEEQIAARRKELKALQEA